MIGLRHDMPYRLRVRGPMAPTRGSLAASANTGKCRKERSPATGSTRASPCPVGIGTAPAFAPPSPCHMILTGTR
jgi:hypothetical protein